LAVNAQFATVALLFAWSITMRPLVIHFWQFFSTDADETPVPEPVDPYQSTGLVNPFSAATLITRASILP
jgi:hypothetical protein